MVGQCSFKQIARASTLALRYHFSAIAVKETCPPKLLNMLGTQKEGDAIRRRLRNKAVHSYSTTTGRLRT